MVSNLTDPVASSRLSYPNKVLRCLELPEIMHHIFSFLDDKTLGETVLLVCRYWLEVNRSRLERRVHWDYRWAGPGLETVLPRLCGASLAQICFEGEESNQVNNSRFKTLMLEYEDWYQQGQQQQQRSSDPLLNWKRLFNAPLTTLEATFCNVPMNVLSDFPFPSSLTNLILEMGSSQTNTFDPSLILKQCPLLEDLLIARWEGWYVDGPWIPHDHDRQQPFRLKGIALIYPAFLQSDLEDLLLLTPQLRELKLAGVMDDQMLEVTKPCGRIQYDRKGFCRLLTALPLKLESFLFSFLPRSLQNGDGTENVVTELCPTLHEWCLWTPDVTPTFLKCLESLPNVITNLELCWNYLDEAGIHPCTQSYEVQVPRLLHQYLCNSPNLLCLKSLQAAYPIRGMDLHRRVGFSWLTLNTEFDWTMTNDSKRILPGIWACRKLKKIELVVHDHEGSQISTPVSSRIVFGYLSRVCPELEFVDVRVPRVCRKDVDSPLYQPVLFKRLDGGLCFLTRLKKLQFLKVCTEAWLADFECKDVDLNWLLPGGRDIQEKKRRKQEIDGWEDWLVEERQLELERLAFGAGEAPLLKSVDPSIPSDTKIYDQLKDLGLISEVKAMVEEMDKDDAPEYLTEFKELSFGLQLGQRPETTMNRVFPDRRRNS
ncbi:hypothetical protein BGZ95_003945 [Linnemannia exigua]|uniref:F-box domain-containing protein n=1 Tax=Linnemannia exigua TaxID=604196 RepID=A0AAD4D5Q0_9FUNG|nr:hypothetical protein BGZ95_003945 [Linnemannia exigua]